MRLAGIGILGVPKQHSHILTTLQDFLDEGLTHNLDDIAGLLWDGFGPVELRDFVIPAALQVSAYGLLVDGLLVVDVLLQLELSEVGLGGADLRDLGWLC